MKYFIFIFILMMFVYSCSSISFENFLGIPKETLKKLSMVKDNFKIIDNDNISSSDILVKIKDFLYKNEADIYFISDTEIYVRNLTKIYKNVSNTTELYIKIEKKDKGSIIKFTSFNIELAEYFVDNFSKILTRF